MKLKEKGKKNGNDQHLSRVEQAKAALDSLACGFLAAKHGLVPSPRESSRRSAVPWNDVGVASC